MDVLQYGFMQKALIAGLMISILGSLFGVFVVQKKMSFMGSGLAHSAFGGVALGLLIGIEPTLTAIPFTILIAIFITWLRNRSSLQFDTIIGIFFSLSVAVGLILLSFKGEFSTDAFSYLFGSILAVSYVDMWLTIALAIILIPVYFINWGKWAYSTFDSELALSDRINVQANDLFLTILIAIVIVVSLKLTGIILASAFLVIPAAAGRSISSSFSGMTIYSLLIGVIAFLIGIYISYTLDIPSGAAIILTQSIFFGIAMIISKIRG